MSRLLSWCTYLPQYGTAGPPRPPPPPAPLPPPSAGAASAAAAGAPGAPAPRPAALCCSCVEVEPVEVPIAAVGIGLRRHGHDDVLANLLDERRGLRRQAVDQLHQHLGGTGLAAVQPAHEVIVRPGRRDELGDLRVGQPARVGDLREVVAVLLQVLDVVVGGDPDDDQLAVLVGLADGLDLDARRGGGERAVVLQRVRVVGELGRVRRCDTRAHPSATARPPPSAGDRPAG